MSMLKYTIIKSTTQYNEYCAQLESLLSKGSDSINDEVELLTLLIEKWDKDQNSFDDKDPIEIIKYLMGYFKGHQKYLCLQ